jgi:hypothetical protein
VFGRGTGVAFSILRRATGIDLLEDLSEFFRSFGDMSQGFRERADRVNALLADRRTAFVLVTSPRQTAIDEAIFFHHRILDGGLPFGAVIANRVHEVARDATTEGLAELLGEELARRVERNLDDYRRLAERDHANLALLRRRLGRKPMIEVPELDDEVHDLDGLRRLGEYLFGPRESVNHPSLSVRALLLDLDGVLCVEEEPVPGSVEAVAALRRLGLALRFVTNTTSRSRAKTLEKLERLGFGVSDPDLVTPAALAVRHCRERGHRRVALLMNDEVKADFAGLEEAEGSADAVIIGDLGTAFGYEALNRAFRLVMDGAELVALQKNRYWLTRPSRSDAFRTRGPRPPC